jgi:hypothetical protein
MNLPGAPITLGEDIAERLEAERRTKRECRVDVRPGSHLRASSRDDNAL